MMTSMFGSKRSGTKYPLATIAAYGPDNRRATKLVVGILRRAGQKDPNPIRWKLESADAHRDVLVQPLLEVLERCVTNPDTASEEEAQLCCYALYSCSCPLRATNHTRIVSVARCGMGE